MALDDDYLDQLKALLPPGAAWSRDLGAVIARPLQAMAEGLARVHARIQQLLKESDPRETLELLPDYERIMGLPDPCAGPNPSIEQRRAQVLARFRQMGGPSAEAIIAFAADLGVTILVDHIGPFRVGRNAMGDPLGAIEFTHVLKVTAPAPPNAVLECELRAAMPAHTAIIFIYV